MGGLVDTGEIGLGECDRGEVAMFEASECLRDGDSAQLARSAQRSTPTSRASSCSAAAMAHDRTRHRRETQRMRGVSKGSVMGSARRPEWDQRDTARLHCRHCPRRSTDARRSPTLPRAEH